MLLHGIDIVEIERIARSLESPSFWKKVFGAKEREYLESKNETARQQSAAGFFAAKEAFGKALGCGISGFALNEVQVAHAENGKPYLLLSGKALELSQKSGCEFVLSISHEKNYAIASVVGSETK